LPGIGKKHVIDIMDERRRKPFESFADIIQRAKLTHPDKIVIKRIIQELGGNEKYYVFTPQKKKLYAFS
jgi:putative nucleotide binding protein